MSAYLSPIVRRMFARRNPPLPKPRHTLCGCGKPATLPPESLSVAQIADRLRFRRPLFLLSTDDLAEPTADWLTDNEESDLHGLAARAAAGWSERAAKAGLLLERLFATEGPDVLTAGEKALLRSLLCDVIG